MHGVAANQSMQYRRPAADLSRQRIIPVFLIIFALITAWAIRHAFALYYQANPGLSVAHKSQKLEVIFFLTFLFLAFKTLVSFFDKPRAVTKYEQSQLNKLRVVAVIPVYNEDPVLLRRCIDSLIAQSRRPNQIYVIDDGSTNSNYSAVRQWAKSRVRGSGCTIRWVRTANGGKRHAQATAFADTPRAKIYLTVDSDSILDRNAVKEGLKPFIDPRIMSVAGVALTINSQKNLLTRCTDLFYVMGQLIDRSTLSVMGSVLVNSGAIAFYRGELIRANLHGYINERFFGRRIEFSDDSMLTLYSVTRGRTVQQKTCFAFTAMPENLSHHIRQYVRWMRGSFIRSFWRFKYLPLNSYAYWQHLANWVMMLVSFTIFVAYYLVNPVANHSLFLTLILIPVLIGYGQSLVYLTVRRTDVSTRSQMLTYSTALFSSLWAYFGLRIIRWYAIITCRKSGWGTRETVEVTV